MRQGSRIRAEPDKREGSTTVTTFAGSYGDKPYELIVFDIRVRGTLERLLSERAAWREVARVELLGPDHAVLVVLAGGAATPSEGLAA